MSEGDREDADEVEALEHASPLEAMLEHAPPVIASSGRTELLVGEVVDARHPTLRGRVRVRWQDLEGQTFEKWLPTLQGLPVRVGDRVVLSRAINWPEAIVTGVVDGFAARPEAPRETKAAVELLRDEAVRVQSADGTPLLELFQGEQGPVVRLLSEDVDLELSGSLRVRAESIEIEATKGQARIKASDDVVVRGEVIHLN